MTIPTTGFPAANPPSLQVIEHLGHNTFQIRENGTVKTVYVTKIELAGNNIITDTNTLSRSQIDEVISLIRTTLGHKTGKKIVSESFTDAHIAKATAPNSLDVVISTMEKRFFGSPTKLTERFTITPKSSPAPTPTSTAAKTVQSSQSFWSSASSKFSSFFRSSGPKKTKTLLGFEENEDDDQEDLEVREIEPPSRIDVGDEEVIPIEVSSEILAYGPDEEEDKPLVSSGGSRRGGSVSEPEREKEAEVEEKEQEERAGAGDEPEPEDDEALGDHQVVAQEKREVPVSVRGSEPKVEVEAEAKEMADRELEKEARLFLDRVRTAGNKFKKIGEFNLQSRRNPEVVREALKEKRNAEDFLLLMGSMKEEGGPPIVSALKNIYDELAEKRGIPPYDEELLDLAPQVEPSQERELKKQEEAPLVPPSIQSSHSVVPQITSSKPETGFMAFVSKHWKRVWRKESGSENRSSPMDAGHHVKDMGEEVHDFASLASPKAFRFERPIIPKAEDFYYVGELQKSLDQGFAAKKEGNLLLAEKHFLDAAKYDDTGTAHYELANIYIKNGKDKLGFEWLEAARSLGNGPAVIQIATMDLDHQGGVDNKSITSLQDLIKNLGIPEEGDQLSMLGEAHRVLGLCFETRGMSNEAVASFETGFKVGHNIEAGIEAARIKLRLSEQPKDPIPKSAVTTWINTVMTEAEEQLTPAQTEELEGMLARLLPSNIHDNPEIAEIEAAKLVNDQICEKLVPSDDNLESWKVKFSRTDMTNKGANKFQIKYEAVLKNKILSKKPSKLQDEWIDVYKHLVKNGFPFNDDPGDALDKAAGIKREAGNVDSLGKKMKRQRMKLMRQGNFRQKRNDQGKIEGIF